MEDGQAMLQAAATYTAERMVSGTQRLQGLDNTITCAGSMAFQTPRYKLQIRSFVTSSENPLVTCILLVLF